MALLTRDTILGMGLRIETVDVPEWGGEVLIREFSSVKSEMVALKMVGKDGKFDPRKFQGLSGWIVRLAVVDESGGMVFKIGDEKKIANLGAGGVSRVAKAAMKLAGMDDDAGEGETEADLLEEAEGNSEGNL